MYPRGGKERKKKKLLQASLFVNASVLVTTTLNPSGCTTTAKRDSIVSLAAQEGSDVIGITETLFALGAEPTTLVEGYRSFYNSVSRFTNKRQRYAACTNGVPRAFLTV